MKGRRWPGMIAARDPGNSRNGPGEKISVTHLITGTSTGGAETMLHKLISRIDRQRFDISVISLTTAGEIGRKIIDEGFPFLSIDASRRAPDPLALVRLIKALRRSRPDILQTWMYHADLVGGLASLFSRSIPVVWNVRHSDLDPIHMKKRTIRVANWCARLSRRLPERIVCCSRASMETHTAIGYDRSRMVVIPNGFDTSLFVPDNNARTSIRKELGIKRNAPLVGLVARYHPQKDHATFLKAAGILRTQFPGVHFALCGKGLTADNRDIVDMIGEEHLGDSVHLLGQRADIARIQASLDIASSSASSGEGFPNIIGEAMSCGVPCVVTDIGDSREIVGDCGIVIEPGRPEALAAGWKEILTTDREARTVLGERCRKRIEKYYEIGSVTARYEVLYLGIYGERGKGTDSLTSVR
jgi:glycosyltransferase involved in cell wall biosynthesis